MCIAVTRKGGSRGLPFLSISLSRRKTDWKRDFISKMGGQQGQGVESCGEILGKVLAQEGYSLFSQRLFASRIKGGHTTIALRIATKEIATIGEHVDCLVALDQETIDIHGKEVPEGGVIIADDAFHPKFEAHTGRMLLARPITELAASSPIALPRRAMKSFLKTRRSSKTAMIPPSLRCTA